MAAENPRRPMVKEAERCFFPSHALCHYV